MDRADGVTRREVLGAGAATALGVGTAGCQTWLDRGSAGTTSDPTPSGDATDTTATDDEPLEVLHGWTDGRAQQGARALADAFEERNPETALTVQAIGGTSETDYDRHLRHRFYDENPPGTFETTPGESLGRYRYVLENCEESVWERGDLRYRIDRYVADTCVFDGRWVAVPVSAHRVNTLFYDPTLLDAAGVDPATLTSLDALTDAFEQVETNTDATPLAHATANPNWTLQLVETLLAARSAHERVRTGAASRPVVRRALETAKAMLSTHTAAEGPGSLAESARRLGTGRAAFVQQGTWMAGILERADYERGPDWNAIPFPGTGDSFLLSLSAFAYPAWNPTPEAAERWLRFVGSPAGQRALNGPRASIPVRGDLSTTKMGSFAADVYEHFTATFPSRLWSLTHGVGLAPRQRQQALTVLADHYRDGALHARKATPALYAAIV